MTKYWNPEKAIFEFKDEKLHIPPIYKTYKQPPQMKVQAIPTTTTTTLPFRPQPQISNVPATKEEIQDIEALMNDYRQRILTEPDHGDEGEMPEKYSMPKPKDFQ